MAVSRDQIIALAIRHLNGDPTASMAQIAEATGVSRATLHRYFAGREELLVVLGSRALDGWERVQRQAAIEEAAASADPARITTALHELLAGLVNDVQEHGFALTEHVMTKLPGLQERADELEEREIAFYLAAQRAGVLRSDLPVRWISNTVYGLLVAVRESLRRGDVARRDIEWTLLDTFLRGTA
ncbi:TetR/AcrR family transcriptional regulator [Streptosporangium canum]|uniref:TetR/AcrR family transcriptional regulator n=1 Tax=Streptosporangium canum TaxID=324952 RepID=UPI00341BE061